LILSSLLIHSYSCSFFSILPPPPRSTLFPYTTLFRSKVGIVLLFFFLEPGIFHYQNVTRLHACDRGLRLIADRIFGKCHRPFDQDRKSTRLNSSHVAISYAVFCLKKKKKYILNIRSYV